VTNERRAYSEAETVALVAQVDGHCPVCDATLFNKKRSRTYKVYELAHIYPLNPLASEVAELAHSPRLHANVNDPDNIIPLCPRCHEIFDKPRTADEYAMLYQIKVQALQHERQRALAAQFPLEEQIASIVAHLHDAALDAGAAELQLTAKTLDQKLDGTMPAPTKRKVRHAVEDYFAHVRAAFLELERTDPGCSQLIFGQVRAFYLKQKSLQLSQAQVFANVVQWIRGHAQAKTLESAEAVASFFIQNCEVFE
jgi:hypothetical protein